MGWVPTTPLRARNQGQFVKHVTNYIKSMLKFLYSHVQWMYTGTWYGLPIVNYMFYYFCLQCRKGELNLKCDVLRTHLIKMTIFQSSFTVEAVASEEYSVNGKLPSSQGARIGFLTSSVFTLFYIIFWRTSVNDLHANRCEHASFHVGCVFRKDAVVESSYCTGVWLMYLCSILRNEIA